MRVSVEGIEGALPWADCPPGEPGLPRDEDGRLIRPGTRKGWARPDDPRPCDSCPWTTACADTELACSVFRVWTVTGRVRDRGERIPTGDEFRKMFRGSE